MTGTISIISCYYKILTAAKLNCRCDKEYFLDEAGLTKVPEGDWFCVPCVARKDEMSSKTSRGGKRKATTDVAPTNSKKTATLKGDAPNGAVAAAPPARSTRSRK